MGINNEAIRQSYHLYLLPPPQSNVDGLARLRDMFKHAMYGLITPLDPLYSL